jgi:hemoglobin/transferrin/lactoferrin receptor protein
MSKIRTLLLLILITAATTLSASVLSHGQHWVTVISKNSGQPVEGVSITVNYSYMATTGPLGRVLVSDLHEGDVVSFFHTSYAPRHYNFKQLQRANFEVGLYESVLNIQEVVIKANRMEADFKHNPQEVRTISAKRMSSQFIGNSADALSLDPNVFIQKSQAGGGSPMIRGMSTSRVLDTYRRYAIKQCHFQSRKCAQCHQPRSIEYFRYGGKSWARIGSTRLRCPWRNHAHVNTYDAHYGDSSEVLQSLVYDFSTNNSQLTRRPNFRINYGGLNWAGMTNITYSQYSDVRMGARIFSWTPANSVENYLAMCEPITFANLDTLRKPMDPLIQPKTAYDQRNFTQKLKFRVSETSELKFGLYFSMLSDVNRYDRFIETEERFSALRLLELWSTALVDGNRGLRRP